jgi:hypothetical protein
MSESPPGGERPDARPVRCTARPAGSHAKARPRKRQARCAADRDRRDKDLDAYIKEMIDALPPLTPEQRDLLALIFGRRRRTLIPGTPAPRRPGQGQRGARVRAATPLPDWHAADCRAGS